MAGYGGPWMGSLGGGGGCTCVNPPHHYPGCWKRCGGNIVYYFGSQGVRGVQDSGTDASQGCPNIEGFLGILRSLLESQDVTVNIVVKASNPLPQCREWRW